MFLTGNSLSLSRIYAIIHQREKIREGKGGEGEKGGRGGGGKNEGRGEGGEDCLLKAISKAEILDTSERMEKDQL